MAINLDTLAFDPLTADPSSPVDGQVWYNSTDSAFRQYRNGQVRTINQRKFNSTTTAPASANDNTQGYDVGSLWLNTTSNTAYICKDATTGAAVWLSLAGGSGASPVGAKGDVQFKGTGSNLDAETASGQSLNYDTVKHALTIGPTGVNLTNNPFSANGTANSYVQSNVQNTSNGVTASSDLVATADNGNDTANFVDVGINSSGSADSAFTIIGANDSYAYAGSGNFAVGTDSAGKDLIFFTAGTLAANERARIKANGDNLQGPAALATNATAGFSFFPGSAGVPTGVPVTYAGRVPLTFDTTNGNLYFYSGGAWKLLDPTRGTNTEVSAAGDITTGSTTDTPATSMTRTPGAGTYQVVFSSDLSLSAAGSIFVSCYANGVLVPNSSRTHTRATTSMRTGVAVTCIATVAAAQAIDIRWRVSTGTGTMGNRSLSLIKVA